MAGLIDRGAEALRAGAPLFTRGNLFHACLRAGGDTALTEAKFTAALRRRLACGPQPGLLGQGRRAPSSARRLEASGGFPLAVILVDRRPLVDLLAGRDALAPTPIAVVCVDGTPAPVVEWLKRGFRGGRRAPVLYLHDAATVLYPFTLEPLATALREGAAGPAAYADLGLPPLGATPRRFGDPTLPVGELVFKVEAIPPATLLRFCTSAARRLA